MQRSITMKKDVGGIERGRIPPTHRDELGLVDGERSLLEWDTGCGPGAEICGRDIQDITRLVFKVTSEHCYSVQQDSTVRGNTTFPGGRTQMSPPESRQWME